MSKKMEQFSGSVDKKTYLVQQGFKKSPKS